LDDFLAYAGIMVAIVAVIPLYVDLILRWRADKDIDFELERFYEKSADPVESTESVRVLHPNRAIDHCKIYLDDEALPFWDSHRERPNYEKKIRASGGANVRIPESLLNDDAYVTVKDGERTLRRMRLREVPRVN
jgi:hypothetical protein